MLYNAGLAYQAEAMVNYDPVDKTVLANEQVDANGYSWRSGAKVEQRMLKQWFLKIKAFQEPLLDDLDMLAKSGNWPERVIAQQRNWLGRSQGTKLWFDVQSGSGASFDPIDVFTTRLDTLFGVQFVALSLNHPIVKEMAELDDSVRAFVEAARDLPADSKAGLRLQGITVRHPLSEVLKVYEGTTFKYDTDIPVFVAPYVLDDYGSGAVMGVPGHDARDHAFWRVNSPDKPVRRVIVAEREHHSTLLEAGQPDDAAFVDKGFVASDIPLIGGRISDEAVVALVDALQKHGSRVEKTENWRLRDWLISRQRYWGTPIPIVHCASCGPQPAPLDALPIKLPQLPKEYFLGKTGNPLAEDAAWKKTECPKCHGPAERETDTMDTFMDSSWYFFRFLDPKNRDLPVSPTKANEHMPVDIYVGGVEHAILHLLYARFISKFLTTVPKRNESNMWLAGGDPAIRGEPFKRLVTQGMVHGKTYTDPNTGRFLRPEEVSFSESSPVIKSTGETPKVSFEKMSKSKYNGVDPGATIAKYGADVVRAHILFQAPVSDVLEWDETSITGVQRWLTRVTRLSTPNFMPQKFLDKFQAPKDLDLPLLSILRYSGVRGILPKAKSEPQLLVPRSDDSIIAALATEEATLWSKTQTTIASVTKAYDETVSLNTVISDLMTLTNTIWDAPHTSETMATLKYFAYVHMLRLLAPIAPATTEECWNTIHAATNAGVRTDVNHPLRCYGSIHPVPSIFSFGFPTADLDLVAKLNQTTNCVVQVNGKKKFEVAIPKVPQHLKDFDTDLIARYVLEQLVQTDAGREWLDRDQGQIWKLSASGEPHQLYEVLPMDWMVIVAKRGAIVNLFSQKKKKKDGIFRA
jgi:leucyl-tRNA synthetase